MTLTSQPTAKPPRMGAALLFVVAACWMLLASWLSRAIAGTFGSAEPGPLLYSLQAALLIGGFYLLARRNIPTRRPLSSVGFVRRPTAAPEFGLGVAIGWGIALGMVLPLLLLRRASLDFDLTAAAWQDLLRGAATLSMLSLVAALIFSGLAFRLLVEAAGPTLATVGLMLLTAALSLAAHHDGTAALAAAVASLLSSVAWLRTRALWLPLGLNIGWLLVLRLLFGMPSTDGQWTPGVVRAQLSGPPWLSGGELGPGASWLGVVVLLAALAVLVRTTRDYAWHYTYEPIVGAGYPMDVAPPAEHQRMEAAAAAATPLVQIQAAPSATAAAERSAGPVPEPVPEPPARP